MAKVFTLECPKSQLQDAVNVASTVWICQHQDGSETEIPDGYDGDSPARCPVCGHAGKYGEWKLMVELPVSP